MIASSNTKITQEGTTLFLGTLERSTGNVRSIGKNITSQLQKRINERSIIGIQRVKAVIPKTYPIKTEEAIRNILPDVFPTASETYIYSKEENPDELFIKVIFKEEKADTVLDLGLLIKSTGNINSIKKNMTKQFQQKLELVTLENFKTVELIVPFHNENTGVAINEVVSELIPQNTEITIIAIDSERLKVVVSL